LSDTIIIAHQLLPCCQWILYLRYNRQYITGLEKWLWTSYSSNPWGLWYYL